MEMKKGFIFTMDVLIGLSLIFIIFIFAFLEFGSVIPEKRYQKLNFVAEDTMDLLLYLKVRDVLDKPTVASLIEDGVLRQEDFDTPILDIITGFYYVNNKTLAANITQEVLEEITDTVNLRLEIDDQYIYNNTHLSPGREVAVASRIESGYEPGKPTSGYIARAYLNTIRGKRDSAYTYFGGYVGEGNITKNITLPLYDNILEAYMEMDVGGNFSLYINNATYAGYYMNGTAGGQSMRADKWTICSTNYRYYYCKNFTVGENKLSFNFTTNTSFIGGGYVRVTYNTTKMSVDEGTGKMRYRFPGIYGLINLYDSFYVPGIINTISAHLHFHGNSSNSSVYLNIGNKTVYRDNSTLEKIIDLDNAYFSSILNYNDLSNKTVPLRMGTEMNITKFGVADVILITDLSGSMLYNISSKYKNTPNNIPCDDPRINTTQTDRISKAKCLDKEFIDIILNTSGNRIGLVGYDGNSLDLPCDNSNYVNDSCIKWNFTGKLSNDINALKAEVDNYHVCNNSNTCIGCSINSAYEILKKNSDSSRLKFIVVMTDGVANVIPFNRDMFSPCYIPSDKSDDPGCGDFVSNESINQSIYAANRTHVELGATIYSVGFGLIPSCINGSYTLMKIAEYGGGANYSSNNVTELGNIYRKIAKQILELSFTTQIANLTGNITRNNTLYPDSYIEFTYTPSILPADYGEISLTRESQRFGSMTGNSIGIPYKEGSFNSFDDIKVVDAKVTSYSSEYWTDRLWINSSKTGGFKNVYTLGYYDDNYIGLGDPYIVNIPVDLISSGNNTVRIETGTNSFIRNGGSPDDRVIGTMRIKSSVPYGDVFNTSQNATDDANKRLKNLVQDYVDFTVGDIVIENRTVKGIKWLWGPTLLKIVVWGKNTTLGFWNNDISLIVFTILVVLTVIYVFRVTMRYIHSKK